MITNEPTTAGLFMVFLPYQPLPEARILTQPVTVRSSLGLLNLSHRTIQQSGGGFSQHTVRVPGDNRNSTGYEEDCQIAQLYRGRPFFRAPHVKPTYYFDDCGLVKSESSSFGFTATVSNSILCVSR